MTSHFLYEGKIPERVIVFGDPARADLVKGKVEKFEELFYNREFRGVRVKYNEKEALLLSTGIGGASTAIAIREAYMLGGREFIRVGTCGVVEEKFRIGNIIIATGAIKEDGLSNVIIPPEVPALPSPSLTNDIMKQLEKRGLKFHIGIVRTHDYFYESEEEFIAKIKRYKDYVIASEMEMAVVFAEAMKLKAKAAGALVANTPEYIDWKNKRIKGDLSYLSRNGKVEKALREVLLSVVVL